jgi:peptidoglycan-N-acetylglucosamine deacetylase
MSDSPSPPVVANSLQSSATMIRHLMAPIAAPAARSLRLARTLPSTHADGRAIAAITFDDGPHPEGTPRILELLAAAGARATFFVVGEQVRRRPALLRRMLSEGHGIALHGDQHRLQLRLSGSQLEEDLRRGLASIEDATGTSPRHHRAPYGIYSATGLQAARERALTPLLWSAWGRDWRAHTTPARIAARVIGELTPGAVILLHDADFYSASGSHERTAQALPEILAVLNEREIGTVSVI